MRSYQHLSREDREEIAARRAAGHRLGPDVAISSIDHYQHRPVLQAHVRECRIPDPADDHCRGDARRLDLR